MNLDRAMRGLSDARPTGLADEDAFLMINLRSQFTGLPMNIWVGPRGRARHAARIKVQMDHRAQFDIDHLAVVSLDASPQLIEGHLSAADLDRVRAYIALNRAAILDHWHERTDGAELVSALRKIKDTL